MRCIGMNVIRSEYNGELCVECLDCGKLSYSQGDWEHVWMPEHEMEPEPVGP